MNTYVISFIAVFLSGFFNFCAGVSLKTSVINKSRALQLYKYIILGVLFYGLAFIFYYISLKKLSIAIAYSLGTATTIFLLTLRSVIFLNKSITLTTLLGFIMIPIVVLMLTWE